MIVELSLLVLGLWLYSRLRLLRQFRAVATLPGLRQWTDGLHMPGLIWNLHDTWKRRFSLYKEHGNDTISLIPYLAGRPAIYTSNMDVTRQVIGGSQHCDFLKPEEFSQVFLIWGPNIVSAEGDTWRKHRKVIGPPFRNSLYETVWEKTAEIYKDMIQSDTSFAGQEVVEITSFCDVTSKLAMLVFASCGFGFPVSWNSPPQTAKGQMTVLEALTKLNGRWQSLIFTMIPKMLWSLPFASFQNVKTSYNLLWAFMENKIKERQAEITQDGGFGAKTDVLSLLIEANSQEKAGRLDERELIGNIYVMLFAGHETTGRTLAATFAYMCIYPEMQEEVYQQIQSVLGAEADSRFADHAKLDKVLAVFYEAGRLTPAAWMLIRQAATDTVLEVPNPVLEGGTKLVPLPKGTNVIIDMVGMHRNARHFEEPDKFKPERWYGLAPGELEKRTFFSFGPRACLGRKFAETEAVCFLAHVLRDYRVEAVLSAGESVDEWKESALRNVDINVTLGIKHAPMRFVRRG